MDDKKSTGTSEGSNDSSKDRSQDENGLKPNTEQAAPGILPVHDEIFPFACGNEKCGHEYNHFDFCIAANQWGYIFLSNDENSLIGLTCPSCKNTTVRKYSLLGMDLKGKIPSDLSMFALFLTGGIQNHNENNNDNAFSIPDYIKPAGQYPKWFRDECMLRIGEAPHQCCAKGVTT